MKIKVLREDWADDAVPLPAYETAGAAGADLRACFPNGQGMILDARARALIPTGLRVEIPEGYEVQIRPRSGLALKHGVTVANAPGTIDSDYRGPLGVILLNTGTEPFEVKHGERVAQMVVAPVVQAAFEVVQALTETDRGAGGFGSTGRG